MVCNDTELSSLDIDMVTKFYAAVKIDPENTKSIAKLHNKQKYNCGDSRECVKYTYIDAQIKYSNIINSNNLLNNTNNIQIINSIKNPILFNNDNYNIPVSYNFNYYIDNFTSNLTKCTNSPYEGYIDDIKWSNCWGLFKFSGIARDGRYIGEFLNYKFHGFGIKSEGFSKIDLYIGNFENGKKNGFGKLYNPGFYNDKTLFIGYFKNNYALGFGKLFDLKNNTIQEGFWIDDNYISNNETDFQKILDKITNYNPDKLTLLEQILNYSWLGEINPSLNDGGLFAVSRDIVNNKCEIYLVEYSKKYDTIKIKSFFDLNKFNSKGFSTQYINNAGAVYFTFGDEKYRDSNYKPIVSFEQYSERMKNAWNLAFKECPGVKTPF